jgi:hypothetical protein
MTGPHPAQRQPVGMPLVHCARLPGPVNCPRATLGGQWPPPCGADHRASLGTRPVFRAVVEEGVSNGDFTVTALDPVLQCMHAAMSQTPAWCAHLSGRARQRAIDTFADTVMMLVGVLPAREG